MAALRSELAKSHGLDADDRELLHGLAREVDTVLEGPFPSSRATGSHLRDRLADRLTELEVSHPKLSSTVSNIVDTLAFYNL